MMAWLTWRIGAFVFAGLLAFVGGVGLYDGVTKRAEIRTLNGVLQKTAEQLKAANESLGTCHANYRGIELALDRQGNDIRGLAKATDDAGKRAAEAAAQGKAATLAAREASQRVLALPRPAPDMACEAAARLLRGPL